MEDKPINIAATISLVKSSTAPNLESQPHVHSGDVQDCLGVTDLSVFAPYRLWPSDLSEARGPESFELNTIGRSVEHILEVASVSIKQQVYSDITKSIIYRLYSMGLQTLYK
jgi:hypothetical protein